MFWMNILVGPLQTGCARILVHYSAGFYHGVIAGWNKLFNHEVQLCGLRHTIHIYYFCRSAKVVSSVVTCFVRKKVKVYS